MRLRHLGTLVVSAVAAAFVATHGTELIDSPAAVAASVGGELPEAIDELANLATPSAKGARPGRHLGFDTYAYPGDQVMWDWQHADVPYEWVGYYLPSPCHNGT